MAEKSARILIVDDEPDTCANLSDIFSDLGYQTSVAYDGPSAIELVKHNMFDVAILDLNMPGMDGLELYRRIRQLSAGTVAIVVTAYVSSSTAAAALEAGAWKILSKPVDFPQLLGCVDEALNQPLILIVDDDQELCDTLWELFRERGYRVCVANDGPEAIEKLRVRDVQVMIVDLKLPSSDGCQVLSSLRESHPDARSIVITGHREELESRVRDAIANGASGVCYKPFDVDSMLARVAELCQEKAACVPRSV
jgi:two-component system response regulator HydG